MRARNALIALGAAAALMLPAAPASATGDNCFIHTDDWVACVCQPVAAALSKLTGDPWTCA